MNGILHLYFKSCGQAAGSSCFASSQPVVGRCLRPGLLVATVAGARTFRVIVRSARRAPTMGCASRSVEMYPHAFLGGRPSAAQPARYAKTDAASPTAEASPNAMGSAATARRCASRARAWPSARLPRSCAEATRNSAARAARHASVATVSRSSTNARSARTVKPTSSVSRALECASPVTPSRHASSDLL
jgi:hypothetical protein